MWFHASPKSDLEKTGIDPRAEPHVSYRVSGWAYFGSMKYLEEQYFKYAPKMEYYIYTVDLEGVPIDDTPLPGEQIRTGADIPGRRLKLSSTRIVQ